MDRILKNNKKNKKKLFDKKEDKKNNDAKFSSILDLLIPSDFIITDNNITSESVNNTNNINHLSTDNKPIINVLEDDYKFICNPSSSTNNENVNISPQFETRKNSSLKHKKDNHLSSKTYSPNKIKKKENIKELDRIIFILKSEYRLTTSVQESFEYSDFNSMADNKRNAILNKLQDTVFSSFEKLNQLSKLSNSNNEIKEALQEIFKLEDITNQSAMHAYNIYSFMKMYQYKRNFNNTNNDGSTNKLRFNKKQFDSVKFARDSEIRRLDKKSSSSLSSNESLNLNSLKQERSEMEGCKSIIRLNNLYKSRIGYLKSEIANSKKALSGKISTIKTVPNELMTDLALKGTLSAIKSVEILNNPSKFQKKL